MPAERSGHCLCGAVRFRLSEPLGDLHACHCESCRRVTGSVGMSLHVPFATMRMEADEAVAVYASSGWATRSFCRICGSNLWYRLTEPDAATADFYLAPGLLDDLSGLRLTQELYFDRKPEGYAFVGPTEKITSAAFEAMVASGGQS